MKLITKIIIFLLISFLIFYIYCVVLWYLNPSRLLGIKYNVKGKYNINDFNNRNYFFIVNHDNPCHTDIVIMSNEINKAKEGDKKYVFFSGKCDKICDYVYYKNKYEILQHTNNSIEKCKNILLEDKKNLVFFLRPDAKGNGIYHILKQTKKPLVLVHKTLTKNPNNPNLSSNKLLFRGMEYDIEYELINDYPIEKPAEDFMEWIKIKLYDKNNKKL